ncbi:MAG: carboxypeptidase regulatory-like domain-containing protein [bacterium]
MAVVNSNNRIGLICKAFLAFSCFLLWLLAGIALPQEGKIKRFDLTKPQINAELLNSRLNLDASITLTDVPGGLFMNGDATDEKDIAWEPDLECTIRYGRKPGNRNLENYPVTVNIKGKGKLVLNPHAHGMGTGIYYCILTGVDDPTLTSVEFKVIVQAEKAPIPNQPKGVINLQKTPEFRWDVVRGVPYYFLFLSEGKISIERNEEDEITGLGGLNLTWQVLTSESSIQFGKPDPSENFDNAHIPPLLPGVKYNWIVLNSYGPSTDLVSGEVAPLIPTEFEVTRPVLSATPTLVFPENEGIVTSDEIIFQWQPVADADRYRVFLYEQAEFAGNTIKYTMWSQVTGENRVRLAAKNLLVKSQYFWRVIAENSNGISSSERQPFQFDGSAGWAKFEVSSKEGPLSRVSFDIRNDANASTLLPALTDTFGISKIALPTGNYSFTASRPGFLTSSKKSFTVALNDTVTSKVELKRGTTTLSGQIVDATGTKVFNARVQLKSGGQLESTKSDADGYFLFSLNPGNWSIRVYKPGYEIQEFQPLPALVQDEARNLGTITLKLAQIQVSGQVKFAADGRSLPGVRVQAQSGDVFFATTTDDQGKYTFMLGPGNWQIKLNSQGFYKSPSLYSLNLVENQAPVTTNFQLFTGSLIYGSVRFQERGVVEARVLLFDKNSGEMLQSVTTNNQGAYSLGVRDAGTYLLAATHPDFLEQQREITVTGSETLIENFDLTEAGFVAGTVKHADTQLPLQGVKIFAVEDTTRRTLSDANGQYLLSLPPETSFNIDAELAGFDNPGPFSVRVSAGATTTLNILMKPISSGILKGKVTNGFTPVAGALVEVISSTIKAETDLNGDFEIELPPGNYNLKISKECHIPRFLSLVLAAGEIKEETFVLDELTSVVAGNIRDRQGAAISGAFVQAAEVPVNSETFSDSSDVNGVYEICLQGGQFRLIVTHPGYKQQSVLIAINDGDRKTGVDFTLDDNFSMVSGRVVDTSGVAIPQADVQLENDFQILTDVSDSAGLYVIESIFPGLSRIRAQKAGFFGKNQILTIAGQEQLDLDLTLYPENGFISGSVRNYQDNQGLDGATVTATFSEDTDRFYTDTTDASGNYELNNLPVVTAATFTLSAFKKGFISKDLQSGIAVNSTHVDFILINPDGVIAGVVQDVDTGEPLANAKVERSGSTLEHFTDDQGKFLLTALDPTEVYTITASKTGFKPSSLENISVGDTNVVVELLRRYAYVMGTVTDGDSLPMENVEVQAIPGGEVGREKVTFTDASGHYKLRLIADSYEIRPVKLNFRNSPPSSPVSLIEDSTQTGVDFMLTPQQLQFINILGETEISNDDQTVCFVANPKDLDNLDIENIGKLKWSVDVSNQAARIDSNGCLQVNANFFGELIVTATEPGTEISGNLKVIVKAPVDSTTETILFDDRGLQLILQKGSILTSEELLVSKLPVVPAKKGRAEIFTADSSFTIKPAGTFFVGTTNEQGNFEPGLDLITVNSTVKLSLPAPPNTENQRRFIAKWNDKKSKWDLLASSEKGNNRIEANIFDVGEYVALALSKPLDIENFTLLPNPFSPEKEIDRQKGLKIEFDISSMAAPNPLLTVKIYNLEGNLVRVLHDQTPFPRGHSVLYWDGTTDKGSMGRNGRYIIQFILQDPSDKREKLKSVVLIK